MNELANFYNITIIKKPTITLQSAFKIHVRNSMLNANEIIDHFIKIIDTAKVPRPDKILSGY